MDRFTDKVALVTGGASGIGAAVCGKLVAEGASVVLLDLQADAVDQAQLALGDRAAGVVADVTQEADVERAVAVAVERFGGVDAAFNVAGAARFGTITDIDSDDWRFGVEVLLNGAFYVTRHVARRLREQGRGGVIVNVSSINAHLPIYGGSSYVAGKAAVEALTKNSALELGEHGIRVNAVLPGLTDTPMAAPLLAVEDVASDYLSRIVMRRAGRPEEIADACLYLASDQASYVNGASLVVDGGWEISNYPDLRAFVAAADAS
jgi:NAD(P)-dependent dehydrogenase (short-subunit alcohol dehydrogenase family)